MGGTRYIPQVFKLFSAAAGGANTHICHRVKIFFLTFAFLSIISTNLQPPERHSPPYGARGKTGATGAAFQAWEHHP